MSSDEPEVLSSRLRHDLRGAAVNIRGFHHECTLAATELRELLELHRDQLPDAVRAGVPTLIDDDLLACLDFLGQAVDKLESTLDNTVDPAGAARTDIC